MHVSHLDHLLNNQAKGNKNQEKVVTKWAGQAQRERGEREGGLEGGRSEEMGEVRGEAAVVSGSELKQRKCLFTSSHAAGHMVIIYFGHICGP